MSSFGEKSVMEVMKKTIFYLFHLVDDSIYREHDDYDDYDHNDDNNNNTYNYGDKNKSDHNDHKNTW